LRKISLIALVLSGALLLYASSGLPGRGDPDAPSHREQSPAGSPVAAAHYIRHAQEDAASPNIVTVVLADYRGFDTLGETIVVLTAGLVCYLVLRRSP
jgi:multicomponent Na+:H+ antiporter subunit B